MHFTGTTVQEKIDTLSDREKTVYLRSLNIVTIFSIFGSASLLLFSAYHYFVLGNVLLGFLECIFSLSACANIIYTRATGNTVVGAHVSTVLLYGMLIILVFTGGIGGTGAYWVATFPVVALFLTGARSGRKWVLLLFVSMVALSILELLGVVELAYRPGEMRQIIASFFVVSGMLAVFANRIEVDEDKHMSINAELETMNERLSAAKKTAEQKAHEAEEARKKMEASTRELEETLEVFTNREIRMSELKEEMKKMREDRGDS